MTAAVRLLPLGPLWWLTLAAGMSVLSLAAAAGVIRLGFGALALVGAAGLLALAVLAPRATLLGTAVATILIEPSPADFTRPLALAWYGTHPAIAGVLPVSVAPWEVLLLLSTGMLMLTRRRPSTPAFRPPLVLWLVPPAILAGLAYGLWRGAPLNIALIESRAFFVAAAAFVAVLWLRDVEGRRAVRLVLATTGALAVVLLLRYALYVRTGQADVAFEFTFAHEGVLFLAVGFLASAGRAMQRRPPSERFWLTAHALLCVVAIAATGRRSGTLVLLLAGAVLLLLYLRRRPVFVISLGLIVAAVGTVYLAAFWHQQYGVLAQPARAVRSQFDPVARDQASDLYRETEKRNVLGTIEVNPLLGVGFGHPFISFEPLPSLEEWWPLQLYTPHQNLLWVWLKAGFAGIVALLALWVTGLARVLRGFRLAPRGSPAPLLPLVVAGTLFIYLGFASVDLVLVSGRAMLPLAGALALAFTDAACPAPGAPTAARR